MARKSTVTESEAAKVDKTVPREVTKAADFFSVYVNDVQIMSTFWDMRLTVGQIVDLAPRGGEPRAMKVEQVGEIRISPQLAKRLAVILESQVANYEQNFGPIPSPES